jgi:molybdenum cofactor synthesis domain-containing protein
MTTAACIIIGDEILSGKIRDTNAQRLIDLLREIGVSLRRIVTVSDQPEEIAEEVRRCSDRFDYVFTSGGLGPTHDDRTVEGVARAFSCPVVRHPELEALVRGYWGSRVNESALKMTEVPEGARLIASDARNFPTVAYRNIYILPGVPQLFAEKLTAIRGELHGTRTVLQSIYLSCDETTIAARLSQVVAESPAVKLGSYPRMGDADHRVRITVESTDGDAVARAVDRLLELLPADRVIRVEP